MPDDPASLPELSRVGLPALPRLAEYQLLEPLGEGAMGMVYRALHIDMARVVALKVLANEHVQDERLVARFKREMVAVAKLDHPNIVRAHDARQIDDHYVLVMEYLDGVSFEQLAMHLGPLPIPDACELIRQAAEGLDHAHGHGLVHRDIKPSNLLLARNKQAAPVVKILDFGMAMIREGWPSDVAITRPGFVLGTPHYMAPEQIEDSHNVDIRADIYGLGCTFFRLLAGHPPFAGQSSRSIADILEAHESERPCSICELRPEAPAGLAQVVGRMLAKKAIERFQSPQEVSQALAEFCGGCDLSRLLAAAEEQSPNIGEKRTQVADGKTALPPATNSDAVFLPISPPRHENRLGRPSSEVGALRPSQQTDRSASTVARRPFRWWLMAVGILALLAVGVIAVTFSLPPDQDRDPPVERTADDGTAGLNDSTTGLSISKSDSGAVGPAPGRRTGTWILLSWTPNKRDKADLWLFSTDGEIRRRVVRTPNTFETQPRFSPDGRHILFVRVDTPGESKTTFKKTSLWVCQTNGRDQRRLVDCTFDSDQITGPLWASDSEVYFTWLRRSRRETRIELWRMALDDEEPTFVFDLGREMGTPDAIVTDLSIDHGELLIAGESAKDPDSSGVYSADLDGTGLRNIWKCDKPAYFCSCAVFSEDGQRAAWRYRAPMPDGSGLAQYGIAWAKRTEFDEWTVELSDFPDASVSPIGWSVDGHDLLCSRVPSPRPLRTHAKFFLTKERFQDVRDRFELPGWHMPIALNAGQLADWRTLPPDVPLPPDDLPTFRTPLRKPQLPFRSPAE